MGWGPGKSRVTDPKRHFQKPIPLSPLVRIDRERCILCYRCVRFSQEVAEDEQLQLLERGSGTYVGTFDDRPYIAPFHGNIIELCPVGALTSEAYRFRARPWDIEDAGSVCTLCPSQCNVKFTVRDERVARVLARDNARRRRRLAVRQGPLRLPDDGLGGAHHAADDPPRRHAGPGDVGGGPRRGRRRACARPAAKSAAIAGRRDLQRGGLPAPADRPRRAGLAQRRLAGRGAASRGVSRRALASGAGRGGVRTRQGRLHPRARRRPAALDADPRPARAQGDQPERRRAPRFATERPTTLDGGAEETARYAPGDAAAFLWTLASELGRRRRPASRELPPARAEVAGVLRPGLDGPHLGRAAGP